MLPVLPVLLVPLVPPVPKRRAGIHGNYAMNERPLGPFYRWTILSFGISADRRCGCLLQIVAACPHYMRQLHA
jgi:hypothetical protein